MSDYSKNCCGGQEDCPTPTASRSGAKVNVLDKYNCPQVLQDQPCSLLSSSFDPNDPLPVRWRNGDRDEPLCLDQLKSEPAVSSLTGLDNQGNLSRLAPNPSVAGIQVPEFINDEWVMVEKNATDHCFPQGNIKTTNQEEFWGIAAFSQCQSGTVCLSTLEPCEAGKLFTTFPGTMIMWAGCSEIVPDNYTICDGKVVPISLYPDLFAQIGYRWGGSGDVFRLPDMRGRVPRGADEDQLRDDSERYSENGSQSSGVGSYQNALIQCHTHEQGESDQAIGSVGISVSKSSTTVGRYASGAITYVTNVALTSSESDIDLTVKGVEQGEGCGPIETSSNETTVHNAAVHFLMATGCPG